MIALQLLANQFHPHTLSSWEGLHDGLSVMGQVTRGGGPTLAVIFLLGLWGSAPNSGVFSIFFFHSTSSSNFTENPNSGQLWFRGHPGVREWKTGIQEGTSSLGQSLALGAG